jgi:hypothetical protein
MTLDKLKEWWSKPFSQDMDALHWFYFFGLIIAISAGWGMILRYITRDATTSNV